MDTVRKALLQSIKKWESNIDAKSPDDVLISRDDCPLCLIFNQDHMPRDKKCEGCPVYSKTKEQFCNKTPFVQAELEFEEWDDDPERDPYDFRAYAALEVNFLQSLMSELS